MDDTSDITVPENAPIEKALNGRSGVWSPMELASLEEYADEDPDTYRRLSQPKEPVNANFELEAVEDEGDQYEDEYEGEYESEGEYEAESAFESVGELDSEVDALLDAMEPSAEEDDYPVLGLSPTEAALLGLLDEEITTIPAFDFRVMAPILEERERTGAVQAVVPGEVPPRTPLSQPAAGVAPAANSERPRQGSVVRLPRGSRVARRLWRRDLERMAS